MKHTFTIIVTETFEQHIAVEAKTKEDALSVAKMIWANRKQFIDEDTCIHAEFACQEKDQ